MVVIETCITVSVLATLGVGFIIGVTDGDD